MGGRAWSSDEVAQALEVPAPAKLKFKAISPDTRDLAPDTLFIALKGEKFDAHSFLDKAKAGGATAAVVRRGTAPVAGLPFYEVDDTLTALGVLARAGRPIGPRGQS